MRRVWYGLLLEKFVTSRWLAATTTQDNPSASFTSFNMSTPATKEDIQELLAQFSPSLAKFIEDRRADASASFDAKLKSVCNAKLAWKREGHERQYYFHQSILDLVDEAERKN